MQLVRLPQTPFLGAVSVVSLQLLMREDEGEIFLFAHMLLAIFPLFGVQMYRMYRL